MPACQSNRGFRSLGLFVRWKIYGCIMLGFEALRCVSRRLNDIFRVSVGVTNPRFECIRARLNPSWDLYRHSINIH